MGALPSNTNTGFTPNSRRQDARKNTFLKIVGYFYFVKLSITRLYNVKQQDD
jgi:hypothetical protein